jgi:hypothetical protein
MNRERLDPEALKIQRLRLFRIGINDEFQCDLTDAQYDLIAQQSWFRKWFKGQMAFDEVRPQLSSLINNLKGIRRPRVTAKKEAQIEKALKDEETTISQLVAWQAEEDLADFLRSTRELVGAPFESRKSALFALATLSQHEAENNGGKWETTIDDALTALLQRTRSKLLAEFDNTESKIEPTEKGFAGQQTETRLAQILHGSANQWPFGAEQRGAVPLLDPDNEGEVIHVPFYERGPLTKLYSTAIVLARSYRWEIVDSVNFVLTGQAPTIYLFTASYDANNLIMLDANPAAETPERLQRLTLVVDPTLTPATVAKMYQEVRKEFVPHYKPMTEKSMKLAIFAFDPARKETPWRARMLEWNETLGKQFEVTYQNTALFTSHAKKAKSRLLELTDQLPKNDDDKQENN